MTDSEHEIWPDGANKIPPITCPVCQHRHNSAVNISGPDDPAPIVGDISICIYCTAVLEFDKNMHLVRLTNETAKKLTVDQMRDIVRACETMRTACGRSNSAP